MKIKTVPLSEIAHARSGDKGSSSNIGVIAYTHKGYDFLQKYLTADLVKAYFSSMHPTDCQRYELPNLGALNFVLKDILAGGGSRSLRIDSQGKALGQVLLQMPIQVPEELLPSLIRCL